MNKTFETIAKGTPVRTQGKTFYVSDTTGAMWNDLLLRFPPDSDGLTLVYSDVTSAVASCVSGNGDVVALAPDFTTAFTATEVTSCKTKGVSVVQLGKNIAGVWFAERATANLPQNANSAIFTITGKVKILNLIGEVTTAIQNQAINATLSAQSTDGNISATNLISVALCAATSIASDAIGTIYTITGTLANNLQSFNAGGVAQAAPIIVRSGTIKVQTNASNTGQVKWRVDYVPVEPGARIFAA